MEINREKPILVTGGSGYIASWIVKYLLEEGYNVRATVRNKSNPKKVAPLEKLAENTKGKLELYEADLLKDGSFDEAVNGCELVMHTASPFFLKVKDPQKDLIEPALNGTINVLESVSKAGTVKRVVLTSSVAAIYSDSKDIETRPGNIFTEEQWNTASNLKHNAYSYSKTLAEQKAWELVKAQKQWDLVVINPSLVLGPSLTNIVQSGSVEIIKSFLDGTYASGVPETYFGVVDVRDVAKGHINAGFKPEAEGRHIFCSEELSMLQIADILKEKYSKYKLPKMKAPKFLLYIVGPIIGGVTWKWIGLNYGIPVKFDNSRAKEKLGINFRAALESINAHAAQLEDSGLI